MTSEEMKHLDSEYVLQTYGRFDLCLVEGKGCRAKDPEGNSYLDFTSGIGVNCLGWCDEEWTAAVAAQAGKLQHTSNIYYTEPYVKLAEALCKKAGMSKVFFANSGAEANEGAIKAARKYSKLKYGAGRHTVLTLKNSFHGRTLATLTATGQDTFHKDFDPFLPGIQNVEAGDIGALKAALDGTVCAVMLEVIQGEGGIIPFGADYLEQVQGLCAEKDVLLIADEVQTGVGRTGAFLASQGEGLAPDIVTLAKGLAGGLPIGALLVADKCKESLVKGDHATTFGANPVVCAGALVVLNRMTDAFLENVRARGAQLKAGLEALPGVEAVTGKGMMLGISFKEPLKAADVLKAAMAEGLLCLLAKDKLRLLPPLILTEVEAEEGLAILGKVLGKMV